MITFYLLLMFQQISFGYIRKRDGDDRTLASRRFILDANQTFTGWASWEQYAACSVQCVSGYEQQTKECCDTGNNRICYNLPWDKLRSSIGTCSDNNDLTKCKAMFSKLAAFQDCISGVTLNKKVDPTDVCGYFQTTAGCSRKYTDLMCPEQLDKLKKTTKIPPSCTENINGSQEATSCDSYTNMNEACQVAYKLPSSNENYAGESYDFICSGRSYGYTICTEKVFNMCYSLGYNFSTLLNGTQYQKQNYFICSDKTGYVAYIDCSLKYTVSDEYTQCVYNLISPDMCSSAIGGYRCALNFVMKTCPASAAYYKRYIDVIGSLKVCNITSTLDIPFTIASASNRPGRPGLFLWTLFTFVHYPVFLQFLFYNN